MILPIRRLLLAAAVPLFLFTAASEPPTPKPPKALESSHRSFPRHYVKRSVRYVPQAQPSAAQVHRIVGLEARRWGVSANHLSARIACESGYRWFASNGQYHGLGQFAYSTFTRGLSTMPRGVRFKASRIVRRPTHLTRFYSDGTRTVVRGYSVKVRRTRIYRGRIPRYPAWTHGHAQVRIMAQAIAGRSAVHDSEWSCR